MTLRGFEIGDLPGDGGPRRTGRFGCPGSSAFAAKERVSRCPCPANAPPGTGYRSPRRKTGSFAVLRQERRPIGGLAVDGGRGERYSSRIRACRIGPRRDPPRIRGTSRLGAVARQRHAARGAFLPSRIPPAWQELRRLQEEDRRELVIVVSWSAEVDETSHRRRPGDGVPVDRGDLRAEELRARPVARGARGSPSVEAVQSAREPRVTAGATDSVWMAGSARCSARGATIRASSRSKSGRRERALRFRLEGGEELRSALPRAGRSANTLSIPSRSK